MLVKNTFFYILFIFLLISCSTKKNWFVNRQYHGLITRFNVAYNGEQAFDKAVLKVEETYADDYRNTLPIEPFSFYAKQKLGAKQTPIGQKQFDRAEEKGAKAIQKHSMLIEGEERNNQTDKAYLLLGKSRYYTKRFGPALEAFQYIIKNHKNADLIYETVIWRAKSNIHIGNVDFGKKALLRLLKSEELSKKERQAAEVGVVMALEKTPDSIESIITHLTNAVNSYKKGPVATRAAFVLGQMHRKNKDTIASDKAFDEVIDMKQGLYKLKLQAKLEKINNHIHEISTEEFLEKVDHLIFVTKNRLYLGKLFYQKGLIYRASDSIKRSKYFFTKSIQKSPSDINQSMLSYQALGDIYYGEKKYQYAKSYYDSLVDVSKNKDSEIVKTIKRKSKSLEKVVLLEKSIEENDSLLKLAALSDEEAKTFFENYIQKIKEQEKAKRLKEQKVLEESNKITFSNESDWYFYNSKLLKEGKIAFFKKWKIKNKSTNWFVASLRGRSKPEVLEDTLFVDTSKRKRNLDKYDVEYYLDKINREPQFVEDVFNKRNLNYYELGNEYYNKLSEKELAVGKLKELLTFNPDINLSVGTYYRLYKIYKESNEFQKSEEYKQRLIKEYPNSSFVQLIQNAEETTLERDDYEECYKIIYDLYKMHSIKAAREEMKQALKLYGESPMAAKYALLNAYLMAKVSGENQFHKVLEEIKLRFPNTVEAQKAEEILKDKK